MDAEDADSVASQSSALHIKNNNKVNLKVINNEIDEESLLHVLKSLHISLFQYIRY
jgi:hypothetical protein